jgi:hypothetical protein
MQRVSKTNERFIDNGDGTVTDNMSGLVWIQNPTLVFPKKLSWEEAVKACQELQFGGHADWRLPGILELHSLLDYTQSNPSLPKSNSFVGVQFDSYWSGTTHVDGATYAWHVYFNYGSVEWYDKAVPYYAWPVRGGQ